MYCPNCKQETTQIKMQWDAQGNRREGCPHCIHEKSMQEGIMHTKFCDAPKGYGGRFLSNVFERKERDQFLDTKACPGERIPVPGSVMRRKVIGVSGMRK